MSANAPARVLGAREEATRGAEAGASRERGSYDPVDARRAAAEPVVVHLPPRPLAVAPAPSAHPAALYLASLAPGSRAAMRSALEIVAALLSSGAADAASLPWRALRYAHVAALRARLAERYAPATTNRLLAAVRGVLRVCWRLGELDHQAYQQAMDVRGVRGTRLPAGRDVPIVERQRLLDVCAADPQPARGARDAAILALLAGTGLRRAEVVALELAHVHREDGSIVVRGKGNKERRVYLVDGARRALDWWLSLRGLAPGPLFCRVRRGARIVLARLTPAAVRVVLERRAAEARSHAAPTAHDFRRTVTGDLLDAGADLASVQALLGHASPTTTARYDRRGERARRKAAELMTVPFTK